MARGKNQDKKLTIQVQLIQLIKFSLFEVYFMKPEILAIKENVLYLKCYKFIYWWMKKKNLSENPLSVLIP